MAAIELQPDLVLSRGQAQRVVSCWRTDVRCTGVERLHGGMVNSVFRLDLDGPPHRVVVKVHEPGGDSFAREATALTHLADRTDCPVPLVLHHDGSGAVVPYSFLLLSHVEGVCVDDLDLTADDRADLDRQLAAVLADLHERTGDRFGRIGDGEEPSSWRALVVRRLAAVRRLPGVGERLDATVLAAVDAAIAAAPGLLDDGGTPRLVHGDVWDGNLVARRDGHRWRLAALLDPDLQFADVELELAYLEVFDNPRPALRAAYEARRPLRPGYEQRRLVHWLHTGLLHVALFEEPFFREFTARTASQLLTAAGGASGPTRPSD